MAAKKTKQSETSKSKTVKGKTKKKDESSSASPGQVFNILDAPIDMANAVGKSMKTVLERRKGREVSFTTQSELMLDRLPLRSIYFQWAINQRGLIKGITNVVARDKLGKTSLVYHLFGGFMQGGHPCAVMYCEGKPLEGPWALRCLSTSKPMAKRMSDRLQLIKSGLLDEMAENLECWCKILRDPKEATYVPMSVALALSIDPLGRLATNAQASGLSEYKGLSRQSAIDIGDRGHHWDRPKWLHDWIDRLLLLQQQYNLHLIAVEHQNEPGVAGGGGPVQSFIPQHTRDLGHRTKRGGQGVNQVANLQLTCADRGFVYSAGEKVARRVTVKPYKNSYGPENRLCNYALSLEPGANDTDTFLEPALRWDYTEVEWLAEQGLLGFRKTGSTLAQERFSSDELKFTQLSLTEAAQVWREASPDLIEELGKSLGIPGYVNVYEDIMDELKE